MWNYELRIFFNCFLQQISRVLSYEIPLLAALKMTLRAPRNQYELTGSPVWHKIASLNTEQQVTVYENIWFKR